jgi:hypothetical protein
MKVIAGTVWGNHDELEPPVALRKLLKDMPTNPVFPH